MAQSKAESWNTPAQPVPVGKAFPALEQSTEQWDQGKCCHLATVLTPEPEPSCYFTIFLMQLCPHAGGKGSIWVLECLCHLHSHKKVPLWWSKEQSTTVIFLLRHMWVPLKPETFVREELAQASAGAFHLPQTNFWSSQSGSKWHSIHPLVFYIKTQQKFITSDVATTAFGRMGRTGVKYVTCSSVHCNAEAGKGDFNKRLKTSCWLVVPYTRQSSDFP